MKLKTVMIDIDGNPVLINESDYISDKHTVWGEKPVKKKAKKKVTKKLDS